MPRKAASKDYLALLNNAAFLEIRDEIQTNYFDHFRAALNDDEAIALSRQCAALDELLALIKIKAKKKIALDVVPAA